jgi:hypothetical protein
MRGGEKSIFVCQALQTFMKSLIMQARALPGPRNAMPLWLAHNSSTLIINNL